MPIPPISAAEIARRSKAIVDHGGNVTHAARALGMPRGTLSAWWACRDSKATVEAKVQTEKAVAVANKEVEKELAELRVEKAAWLAADRGVAKPWNVKTVKVKDEALIPLLVLSDWHLGEEVKREDVPDGCNEFSITIAKQRVERLVSRAIWVMQHSGAMISQDTMILALLGDFMTGWIHEELAVNSIMSPLEEQEFVAEVLAGVITKILKETTFSKIIIPTAHGNHGRNTVKMHIKGSARTSYEHFVYRSLAKQFKNEKRCEFIIGQAYHTLLQVGDIRIRCHHGDGIKSMGGVGGISIPLNKAIARFNSAYRADLDVLGHFHQLLDGGSWVVNGSLIGYTAYAAKIGCAFEAPRQALVLVHPKRGKAGVLPIWAD